MSFLKKMSAPKKKRAPAPTTGEAIQNLRSTEELLIKKQEYLEAKVTTEIATARKNAKTNKRLALQALKRKKKYEQQLQQLDGTLTTIESQRATLESGNTNVAVFNAMGQASRALKTAHANMNVDQVHDMMDDIAEQQDVAREISEAISNPVAFGQDYDEDELEDELNDLEAELEAAEQEDLDRELLKVGGQPAVPSLPDVPVAGLPTKTKAKPKVEDDELDALAAWAS